MGMPTAEELVNGPPIRVCGSCIKDSDTHDGGDPKDITGRTRRAPWITCHRCGRRSRLGWLVDRKPGDERRATPEGLRD